MKNALLLALFASSSLFAQFAVTMGDNTPPTEAKVVLTPTILTELQLIQGLSSGDGIGEFALRDVEAGFGLSYLDKATVDFTIGVGDEYALELIEVFATLTPNENVAFSAGLLTNGFGMLEFNSMSYPLIYDDLETIQPAFMVDAGNEVLYGSLALYQGLRTDNYLSFAPAFGVLIGDIADIKVSGRIEIDGSGEAYSDLAAGFALTPLDFLEIRAEYTMHLNGEEFQDDNGGIFTEQIMGYFAEAAFFVGENWTLAARYDQRIEDYTVDSDLQSGIRGIEGSVAYTILDPLTVSLALTGYQAYAQDVSDWEPVLKLMAAFEL